MSISPVTHLADVGFRIQADSFEELISFAIDGLMQYQKPDRTSGDVIEKRDIEMARSDVTVLLVDTLNEILYFSQSKSLLYRVKSCICSTGVDNPSAKISLEGRQAGHFRENIKAVTYHGAEVRRLSNGKWEVELILDV